ncbi:hypothetical protein PAXINDRAFT_71924, partial [Paxillus involutus ATCC 200175]
HVDNGLSSSNNHRFLHWIKKQIADHFSLSDLGPVMKYLGVNIQRDQGTRQLWMHQQE